MADAVIDVDMAGTGARVFYNISFRKQNGDGELVYLRPHKSGLDDARQYSPILHGTAPWQIYNGPGFTAAVEIPRDEWFHVRQVVSGAQAWLYVSNMATASLVINDLKSGIHQGVSDSMVSISQMSRYPEGCRLHGSGMSLRCHRQRSQNGACRRVWTPWTEIWTALAAMEWMLR